MKFCILGGGGCFGLNTARYLSKNHEVFGIGRSPPKAAPFWLAPDGYKYYPYHVTHEADYILNVLDREKPQVIVNYAAQGEGAASFNSGDWWRFFETNGMGLSRLVGMLQNRTYLERFIHIGSSEVYGAVGEPADENARLKPSSPYSASKAGFDLFLQAVADKTGFPMNIIRPSNCYTSGQQLHRIIPKAMLYAMTNRKIPLHGGGSAQKSYLHATDLSKFIEMVAHKAPLGELYNLGPTGSTRIRDVVAMCAEQCGVGFDDLVDLAPERVGQDARYWLDSTKANKLGWTQTIGWNTGLAEVKAWVSLFLEDLAPMSTDYVMRA